MLEGGDGLLVIPGEPISRAGFYASGIFLKIYEVIKWIFSRQARRFYESHEGIADPSPGLRFIAHGDLPAKHTALYELLDLRIG